MSTVIKNILKRKEKHDIRIRISWKRNIGHRYGEHITKHKGAGQGSQRSPVLVENWTTSGSSPNKTWEGKESVTEAILLTQKLERVWPTWEILKNK